MKLKLALSISIILNIVLIILFILDKQEKDIPIEFNPFHSNTTITYNQLKKQGYKVVPEDVPLLGKKAGNLYIYYQFEDVKDGAKAFWRNAEITLNMKVLDTVKVYQVISSYDADVIYYVNEDTNSQVIDQPISIPLTNPFFVQHRYNKQIFQCYLSNSDQEGYTINISCHFPLTEPEFLQNEKDYYNGRTRFGKDTLELEDKRKLITNYFNWQIHGEEVILDSNDKIEQIRVYNLGTMQLAKEFYANGQIKSNVLSYNKTGQSKWWYENGQLELLISYIDGRRNGPYKEFDKNGILRVSGNHNGGYYDTGIKHGEWKYFNGMGRLDSTLYYQNDTLIKKTTNSR